MVTVRCDGMHPVGDSGDVEVDPVGEIKDDGIGAVCQPYFHQLPSR